MGSGNQRGLPYKSRRRIASTGLSASQNREATAKLLAAYLASVRRVPEVVDSRTRAATPS